MDGVLEIQISQLRNTSQHTGVLWFTTKRQRARGDFLESIGHDGTDEVERLVHSCVCVCELALRAGRVIRSM
jgi:hypothetical protein